MTIKEFKQQRRDELWEKQEQESQQLTDTCRCWLLPILGNMAHEFRFRAIDPDQLVLMPKGHDELLVQRHRASLGSDCSYTYRLLRGDSSTSFDNLADALITAERPEDEEDKRRDYSAGFWIGVAVTVMVILWIIWAAASRPPLPH